MISSSKREFRILKQEADRCGKRERYCIQYRLLRPKFWQSSGWTDLMCGGIYETFLWESSSLEDAECAIESLRREDDPPQWTVVTPNSLP